MKKRKLKKMTIYQLFLRCEGRLDGKFWKHSKGFTYFYDKGHVYINKDSDEVQICNPNQKFVMGSQRLYLRKRLIRLLTERRKK